MINYNGRIYPVNVAVFPLNRAMSYGDGLFESIRIHEGEMLFFDDHLQRMMAGMKALKIEIPDHYGAFFFHKQIMDLAIKEEMGGNARVRISIFRSGGGLYEPQLQQPEYFIQVMPLDDGFKWNEDKFELGIFNEVPKNFSSISFFKSMNALPYVLAAMYRNENQLDDCLLLNSFGKVTDAISSNIFWINQGNIFTTPLSDGCIDGVMRKHLLRIFAERNFSFQEKSILPESLLLADEVFITNVGWGIQPVTIFGKKKFTTSQTKKVFQLLLKSLSKQ
ncbi:MAG: aminotransferase class IV [Chitinophagaceae bacterium]|nr:aminotransferase class IV [Chitinophagaceae bacterium]